MQLKINKRALGNYFESIALDRICNEPDQPSRRVIVLEKNYQTRYGEIDLIYEEIKENRYHGQAIKTLVFCEVRGRSSEASHWDLEASIGPNKRRKIKNLAVYYLNSYLGSATEVRFDVVIVDGEEIRLFEDAFQ